MSGAGQLLEALKVILQGVELAEELGQQIAKLVESLVKGGDPELELKIALELKAFEELQRGKRKLTRGKTKS